MCSVIELGGTGKPFGGNSRYDKLWGRLEGRD
jgi:hypothetical protein